MTRVLMALVGVAGLAAAAQATTFVNETFSYPDGPLAGNGGWTVHSGAGGGVLAVSSGQAIVAQGSGSREDCNVPLGVTMGAGQTFYAAFDFSNANDATTVYFAHFMSTATTFTGRAFITTPASGGDYRIGLSDTSTLNVSWPSDLTFGTTYRAVIRYDFDTKTSTLWVNPTVESDPSITAAAGAASLPVNAFGLRQAGTTSTQTVDNLVIGTSFGEVVPTPGALALLGLGGLVTARRRRA